MKVIKPSEVKPTEAVSPLFEGKVTRQVLLPKKMAQEMEPRVINFSKGARNVLIQKS